MPPQVNATSAKRRRLKKPAAAVVPPQPVSVSPAAAMAFPTTFAALVAATTALPGFPAAPVARWSCWAAAAFLALWGVVLLVGVARRRRALVLEVSLRPQHYIQACAHLTIYMYWAAYWQGVSDAAPLIAAQLAFAYGLDALLSWSRRDSYTIGFGPFPIIFSTNLFLWFKAEWFYLQFLMVAVGFCAREFIRWQRDGRRVHIFNPSSLPLSLVSIVLILTQNTHLTWGQEIATTQLFPPHMYLVIFLVSLPGQVLFGVSRMTLAAVATTYLLIGVDYAVIGLHIFASPTIPIAVFLGMHLLFTDPSTSPRSELGRLIFGALYGASVVALYVVLDRLGVPTFYDKLLPVPILNLLVPTIDRIAHADRLKWCDPGRLFTTLAPRARHVAYTALWAVVFVASQWVTASATTLARADDLLLAGRLDEAIGQYRALVERDASRFDGHNKLGYALMRSGRSAEALVAIGRALELAPQNAEAHNNLGLALIQVGRIDEALTSLQRAAALDPQYVEARYNLGHGLIAAARPAAAVAEFREALRIRPEWTPALGSLAWLQATEGDGVRNPAEAIQHAIRAAQLTGYRDPQVLDVLAAAYAAAGQFPDAIATADTAAALAAGSPDLARQIGERVALYRAGRALVAGR